jgi:hypothetical protein
MSWERIYNVPDVQPGHAERALKNEARMQDPTFRKACEDAGVEPTRRQASKWNHKQGKAYKKAHRIEMTGVRFD